MLQLKHRCSNVLLTNTFGVQERGISQTFNNVSKLCRNRINYCSWQFGPFLRQCFRQVDYVTAQKLKRGQQWLRFYSQLWSRDSLSCLLIQMGRRLGIAFRHRRISKLILAGAAIAPANIDVRKAGGVDDENFKLQNKAEFQRSNAYTQRPNLIEDTISDELISSHTKDLLYIQQLKETTLTCEECQKRHVIDEVVEGIEYCACEKKIASVYGVAAPSSNDSVTSEGWLPFLERKDILVWRRENPDNPGLYAYKMYGKFDDVSAKEFLEVQMDVSAFRMSWDISTAQCHVLLEEKRRSSFDTAVDQQAKTDINQIYYWEVNWPRFFSNRDYVCTRRASVMNDEEEKKIVVYTRPTTNPSCPEKPKNFRVKDYWSVMVIKPFKDLDEVGIEFSLTAFENPGLSLPSSITTWVAIRGMPEFMENLRKACFEMRKWKDSDENKNSSSNSSSSKSGTKTSIEEPSYMETPVQYSSQSTANYSNAYA